MFILFPCFHLLCLYRWLDFTSLIDYQRNVWLKSHLKESDPANSWGCENLDNVQNGRRFFFLLYFFSVLFMVVGGYRGSRIPDHCYQMPEPEWKQWRPRGLKRYVKGILNHHLSRDERDKKYDLMQKRCETKIVLNRNCVLLNVESWTKALNSFLVWLANNLVGVGMWNLHKAQEGDHPTKEGI